MTIVAGGRRSAGHPFSSCGNRCRNFTQNSRRSAELLIVVNRRKSFIASNVRVALLTVRSHCFGAYFRRRGFVSKILPVRPCSRIYSNPSHRSDRTSPSTHPEPCQYATDLHTTKRTSLSGWRRRPRNTFASRHEPNARPGSVYGVSPKAPLLSG